MELTVPVSNYQEYYENGLILVYVRGSNDAESLWNEEAVDYSSPSGLSSYTNYWGARYDGIKNEEIVITGYESSYDNPDGNKLKSLRFDVKVVLVPAGSVTKLSSVNTKNLKLVERALGL